MLMFNWFKKKKAPDIQFGSYNAETGECCTGAIDEQGNQVFMESRPSPVYVGTLSIPIDTYYQTWFTSPKLVDSRKEMVALYKMNGEYFYHREGRKRYINADAFEKSKVVIPLDEH